MMAQSLESEYQQTGLTAATGTVKVKIGTDEKSASGTYTLRETVAYTLISADPPTATMIGQTITLTGTGFNQNPGHHRVGMNNVTDQGQGFFQGSDNRAEAYEVNEDQTRLKIRVHPNVRGREADIDKIWVSICFNECAGSPTYISKVVPFSVTAIPALEITNVTPSSARVGDVITITGTGFSLYAKDNYVAFGRRPPIGIGDTDISHEVNADGTELKVRISTNANDAGLYVLHVPKYVISTKYAGSFTVDRSSPVIDSFSPTSGVPGTQVTITGSKFSLVKNQNSVCFAAIGSQMLNTYVVADEVNDDGTVIKATIPDNPYPDYPAGVPIEYPFPSSSIFVDVAGSSNPGKSADPFDLLEEDFRPIVSSFTPQMGVPGAIVVIRGQNFSTTNADNIVEFGANDVNVVNIVTVVTATPLAACATSLTVAVPRGAKTGLINVIVNTLDGPSTTEFTVATTPPAGSVPVVGSFSPMEGEVGETVTISGSNFSATAEENIVLFNGYATEVPSMADAGSLTVLVPACATTGPITVMVGGLEGVSGNNFTVTGTPAPVVDGFTPKEGSVGTSVTITGLNFSATANENIVKFGGIRAAAPTVASAISLTVEVPTGARTGRISVEVGGQTGTSGTNFTVPGTEPEPVFFGLDASDRIGLYPNPSSGEVRFTGLLPARRYTYKISSLVGQIVLSGELLGGSEVDVSKLLVGQYVLVLRFGGSELLRTRLLIVK